MEVVNDNSCSWINDLSPRHNIKTLSSDLDCEWLVVGAGYTGLSAARKLGQLYPNAKIISIDKNPLDNVEVWLGKNKTVKVYTKENIYKTIKKGQKKSLKVKIEYEGPIEAPIKKDQKVAKLKIIFNDNNIGEYDLLAVKSIDKVNIFSRLMKSLNYLIWGDV